MVDVVCRPEDVTVDWMNAALREAGCLTTGQVSELSFEFIGTGKMGDNARFSLRYDGEQGEAPSTVVGKFPAADETARGIAGAGGAYYGEVMFYRELAPLTAMRTPRIFAAEVSDDQLDFTLLMEDMAPAQPGNNLVGETLERTRLVLGEAAKLAGAFYNQDIGLREFVMSSARDDGGVTAQAYMEDCWPQFEERFGHGLAPEAIAFGENFAGNVAHFITAHSGPRTLTHGDLRSENILYGDGTATVVDWQTPGEGSPVTDAAYFLGGSVDIDDRRAWEKDLIEDYRQQLAQQGVALSQAECWEQYRMQAMHGVIVIVLGAVFSEPAERSDRMFLALIQRHLQQCIDLNSAEFLP